MMEVVDHVSLNTWPLYSIPLHPSSLHLPQAPGRHPQPLHISLSPYTAPFPVRSTSPPHLFLCMLRPMRLACLMPALSLPPKLWSRKLKGSFGTLESQVPQGSIYPIGTRFHIPDFSLISGSPGDKASTRSRGPVTRVTCHGNQDSLRLVPARAVACRA